MLLIKVNRLPKTKCGVRFCCNDAIHASFTVCNETFRITGALQFIRSCRYIFKIIDCNIIIALKARNISLLYVSLQATRTMLLSHVDSMPYSNSSFYTNIQVIFVNFTPSKLMGLPDDPLNRVTYLTLRGFAKLDSIDVPINASCCPLHQFLTHSLCLFVAFVFTVYSQTHPVSRSSVAYVAAN